MKDTVILDLDGTLADVSYCRRHIVRSHPEFPGKRDFDRFHEEALLAPVIEEIVEMAHLFSRDCWIIIVTARKEMRRTDTEGWLKRHGIPWDLLFMRGDKDHRAPEDVKREILNDIRNKGFNPVVAVDDSPKIIEMFKEEGLKTILVPGWMD